MLRILKTVLLLGLLACSSPSTQAFALLGKFAGYQIPRIGYNIQGDIGGPMLMDEGYRWNVPIVTYAFDPTFVSYFGSNGVAEVDKAFALLNRYTTNLMNPDVIKPDLSNIPLEAQRQNYMATTLGIYDMKSVVIGLMMEQLGLASPERYIWCLRDRRTFAVGNTTYTNYVVETRNYDPMTLQQSSYVNGILYTYTIYDQYYINPDVADAIEIPVDLTSKSYTSIASIFDSADQIGLLPGRFINNLTRDDVGGLRYLFRTDNYKQETLPANVDVAVTNRSVMTLLTTTNLADFIANTHNTTNAPATVLALYPNLNLTATNTYLTNITTTNTVVYLTNKPWMPAGTYIYATNTTYTYSVALAYDYAYDNVKTNSYYSYGYKTTRTYAIERKPWSPSGASYTTNTTTSTVLSYFPNGDIYILPSTNLGYSFVSLTPQLTTTYMITNATITNVDLLFTTNASTTNGTSTNVSTLFSMDEVMTYSTNRVFAVYPIEWQNGSNNTTAIRGGMGGILFKRADFNSMITPTFTPVTNYFVDSYVETNYTLVRRPARARVTAPDILFVSTGGLGFSIEGYPIFSSRTDTTGWSTFPSSSVGGTNSAGPGTILAPIQFSFNNIGRFLINQSATIARQTEAMAYRGFLFGSFDGSTNAPVVYPANGEVTLRWLEQVILSRP